MNGFKWSEYIDGVRRYYIGGIESRVEKKRSRGLQYTTRKKWWDVKWYGTIRLGDTFLVERLQKTKNGFEFITAHRITG